MKCMLFFLIATSINNLFCSEDERNPYQDSVCEYSKTVLGNKNKTLIAIKSNNNASQSLNRLITRDSNGNFEDWKSDAKFQALTNDKCAKAYTWDSNNFFCAGPDNAIRWHSYYGKTGIFSKTDHCITALLVYKSDLLSADSKGNIVLWDANTGSPVHSFNEHTNRINSMEFIGDQQLSTGSNDTTLKLWDLRNKKTTHTFESSNQNYIVSHSYNHEKKEIVIADDEGIITFWDINTKKPIDKLYTNVKIEKVSHHNNFFAVLFKADKQIRLYDRATHLWLKDLNNDMVITDFATEHDNFIACDAEGKVIRWTKFSK